MSFAMRPGLHLQHHSSPAAVPSRSMWLARWLLVLLLVWDQAGSPLHHHHHDSGIDGSALTAAHDATEVLHLEDADEGPGFSHAVMAMRPQSQPGMMVAAETDAAALGQVALALVLATPVADLLQHVLPTNPGPLEHSLHRSLPPAGRAPPLHA